MQHDDCLRYFTLKLEAWVTILPHPPANGIFTKNREYSRKLQITDRGPPTEDSL